MQKDKVLEYSGFHNYKSKCHLRFLFDDNQKFIIICSEMLSNNGTSVTNFVEEIQQEVTDIIKNDFKKPTIKETFFTYFKNNKTYNIIDDLFNRLDKRKYKLTPFFLECAKDIFDISKESTFSKEKLDSIFNNLIWIEHYPIGKGVKDKENTYAHVTFENDILEWNYVTLDSICKYTGYSKEQFIIPIEKLNI